MNAGILTPELQHISDKFAQQQAMQAKGGQMHLLNALTEVIGVP